MKSMPMMTKGNGLSLSTSTAKSLARTGATLPTLINCNGGPDRRWERALNQSEEEPRGGDDRKRFAPAAQRELNAVCVLQLKLGRNVQDEGEQLDGQ